MATLKCKIIPQMKLSGLHFVYLIPKYQLLYYKGLFLLFVSLDTSSA